MLVLVLLRMLIVVNIVLMLATLLSSLVCAIDDIKCSLGAIWILSFWRNCNLLNGLGYLAWNLTSHNFLKFTY
jgi:hypothetical protein